MTTRLRAEETGLIDRFGRMHGLFSLVSSSPTCN